MTEHSGSKSTTTSEFLLDVARAHGTPCQVALERGIDRYPEGLTYVLGEDLSDVAPGERVVVPLGRGNHATAGWVLSVGEQPGNKVDPNKLKAVLRRDPSGARLPLDLIELARWISDYYAAPIGVTLASMLPAAVKKRRGEVRKQLVDLAQTIARDNSDKTDNPKPKRIGPGQRKVLEILEGLSETERPIEVQELARRAGLRTTGPIRSLLEKGQLVGSTQTSIQATWHKRSEAIAGDSSIPTPTEKQQAAIDDIAQQLTTGFSRHLLFGVTGSGKTEVYIRLIQAVRALGKVVLLLVPEIALTPQTAGRLFRRFGDQHIALLHSGLTQAQRNQQWNLVADGQAGIVVGARSAVFAPIPEDQLGLVIVDEEHDSSYKQDQAPRYNGRDVAIRRAQLAGCPVLLGSATPSLESWHNAVDLKRMQLHRLPDRAPGMALPAVRIVDFAEERRQAPDRRIRLLGPTLSGALTQTIRDGAQALILLNRRGFANYIACPDSRCGWVMQCEQCDAGMVCHRAQLENNARHDFVRCHHCHEEQRLPKTCPQCSRRVTVFGLGTQRVEEEIRGLFKNDLEPSAIRRIDSDTMRGSADFHEALDGFAREQIRIMLGTQMIAKGLDFPNVRLVGVVNADTALNMPDFRASERTYQLVSQVTGRCGRGEGAGLAIIQSFQPEAPAIRIAAQHDFETFATGELEDRKRFNLPPITRMARLVLRHPDEDRLQHDALEMAEALKPLLGQTVTLRGPDPCAITRIAGHWRAQILLQSNDPAAIRTLLFNARRKGVLKPGQPLAIDVDPQSLL